MRVIQHAVRSVLLGSLFSLLIGLSGCITVVQPTQIVVVTHTPAPANPTALPQPTFAGPTGDAPAAPTLPAGAEYASVIFVIDGDTIDVSIEGREERVRYISVNTPERDEPCYDEATNANRILVENQIVTLVKDVSERDSYGRLLRYVYIGEVFVNAQLVADGWAEARRYNPDTAQYDYLDSLEANAAAQNLGCWAFGVFER